MTSLSELTISPSDLLPGDALLFQFDNPDRLAKRIARATNSPYTHAAIYLGDGLIAESIYPDGIVKSRLVDSLQGSLCVAVLRSQLGFKGDRPTRLRTFVQTAIEQGKQFDLSALVSFGPNSKHYFENQLEFVRSNYGLTATADEHAAQSFFCSAFVVACYCVVGIIGESAQVAYQPEFFSPGHLGEDPTFGWLLGYFIPEGGQISPDDPLLKSATLWRDVPTD